jgi:hypothetical protein
MAWCILFVTCLQIFFKYAYWDWPIFFISFISLALFTFKIVHFKVTSLKNVIFHLILFVEDTMWNWCYCPWNVLYNSPGNVFCEDTLTCNSGPMVVPYKLVNEFSFCVSYMGIWIFPRVLSGKFPNLLK